MNITDIRVRIAQKENSKLKALASITIDSCFVVHDVKIIEGSEGLFVAMPSRKTADGKYKDIAHPINNETRELIHQQIFKAYEECLAAMPEEEAKEEEEAE